MTPFDCFTLVSVLLLLQFFTIGQALVRSVAEEEQRLASKQTFLQETWRHLQDLSLGGLDTVPDISPPEVGTKSVLVVVLKLYNE